MPPPPPANKALRDHGDLIIPQQGGRIVAGQR